MLPIAIVSAVLAVIVLAVVAQLMSRRAARRPLAQVAKRLGLTHRWDSLRGTVDHRLVVAQRLDADADHNLPERLIVTCPLSHRHVDFRASFWRPATPREPQQTRRLCAAEQPSDEPFFAGGDDRAQALLSDSLRRLLHRELPPATLVSVNAKGVHLRFDSGPAVADTLESAIRFLTVAADEVEPAVHDVPAAPALTTRAASWAAWAAGEKVPLSTTPLGFTREIDGLQVTARAVLEATVTGTTSTDYVLELEVLFRQPLDLGLRVRPKQPLASGHGGASSTRRTDPQRFPEVFRVQAPRGARQPPPLPDTVRREMLRIHEGIGAASLDADALRAHRPLVPRDPAPLCQALTKLAEHATAIAAHIGSTGDRRGPYR